MPKDMPSDPFQGQEWERYVRHHLDNVLPQMLSSACFMALALDGPPDVEYATQLGFMVMYDKPIIVVVPPSCSVPPKLAMIADEIVAGDMDDPVFQDRLKAACDRVKKKLG